MRILLSYRLIVFIPALLIMCAAAAFAADVSFIATVDKSTVPLNGYFRLTVEISGPIGKIPKPELPNLSDFYVLAGPSESSSYQFINGRISASKSWSYTLQPRKAGDFTIGAAKIQYKRETFRTEPIKITVYSSSAPKQSSPQPSQPAAPQQIPSAEPEELFLRAVPNKTTLVQNDAVIVEYKLYFRVNIGSYETTKIPQTTGFWTEEFELPRQPLVSTEVVKGRRYQMATIRKIALFPTRPGKMEVGPLEVQCQVKQQRRSRFRDPFDSFFDDPFFGNIYTVPRYVQSQPLKFNIRPFPEKEKPADYSGAVGSFSLEAALDKDSVQTNDPVTLTVKIQGRGNIKMVPPPNLSIPPDFERYGPETGDYVNKSGGYITGGKTFKYLLVPRFPGNHKIAPIVFSYYDPGKKRYITLKSPEFVVEATRGKEIVMPGGISISPNEVRLYGSDIRYIKTEGRLKPTGAMLYRSAGYYTLYILPLVIFLGAGFVKTYQLKRNPARVRARNAFRSARIRLDKAQKISSPADTEEFYREIAETLKGFIADKMGISPAGLVLEEVKDELLAKGIKPLTWESLQNIIAESDIGRFAPSSEAGSRERLAGRAKNLLNVMEAEWTG